MNRVNNEEEREWASLVSRITAGQDWWTSSPKPIPERIWFQRFGVELRDEDFKQDGTTNRGFLIRDRTEARIAASGYSAITNNDKEFKVAVDVWPFQLAELVVAITPALYIMIEGEHKETCEDNSECSRAFTRRYMLPKRCASTIKECNYNKGILTITVEKSEITYKEEKPQKVPITLDSWKQIRSKPFEESNDAPVTLKDPLEVAITGVDSKSNLTKNDEMPSESLAGEVENPKAVPTTSNDTKVDPGEVVETPRAITTANDESKVDPGEVVETPKAVPTANNDSKVDPAEVVETPKALATANNDSKVKDETSKAEPIANEDLKVDLAEVATSKAVSIANGESKIDPGEVQTQKAVAVADDASKSLI